MHLEPPHKLISTAKASSPSGHLLYLLSRMLTMDNENFISNLRFCGGSDVYLSGYSATYLSGDLAARLTIKDMKGEEIKWN